jgi:hypothetical protein
MVRSGDGGRHPVCATCGHIIKDSEKNGAYDDGSELHHGDCARDKYGYDSFLDQRGMSLEEMLFSENNIEKFIDVNYRPPNRYGARRVA